MGGYKGKAKAKKGGGKKGGFDRGAPTRTAEPHNFVADAGPGCVISHVADPPWALGSERIDIRDYPKGTQFPDLAVDPDSGTLAVVNAQAEHRVVRGRTLVPSRRLVDGRGVVPPFNNSIAASASLPIHPDVSPQFVPNNTQCYVTVYDNPVLDRDGNPFPSGHSTDNDGKTRRCVTFILLVPPKTIVHAATLTEPTSEIDSDVQDWSVHPAPDDEHPLVLGFPLGATEGNKPGPWLCTQGEGGSLTHFFSGNLHAVDFRCEEGTPLLAVGAGTVVEVSQANTLTGVAVSNLFKWNSVMIQLDTEGTNAGAGVGTDAKENPENLRRAVTCSWSTCTSRPGASGSESGTGLTSGMSCARAAASGSHPSRTSTSRRLGPGNPRRRPPGSSSTPRGEARRTCPPPVRTTTRAGWSPHPHSRG